MKSALQNLSTASAAWLRASDSIKQFGELLLRSVPVHRYLEKLATLAFLVFANGAFLTRSEPLANLPFVGQIAKFGYLGSGLLLLLLLAVRIHDYPLRQVFANKLVWLFFILVSLSPTFSGHMAANLKSYLFFFFAMMSGFYITLRFTIEEQRDLIEKTILLCLLVSLLCCLFLPDYGITLLGSKEGLAHKGEWRGIFTHKNILGRVAGLGLFLFTHRLLFGPGQRLNSILWMILSGSMLYLSRSTSAVLVTTMMLVAIPVVRSFRLSSIPLVLSFLAIAPALTIGTAYLASHFEEVMKFLGKNTTLSGRVPLWLDCLHHVQLKPWLGYGYGGFWPRTEDPGSLSNPGQLVWRNQGWHAPNAHNGLLELALTVGVVGLTLFLFGFLTTLISRTLKLRQDAISGIPSGNSTWGVFMLLFIFLSNLAEACFLQQFIWVLYVMVALRPKFPEKAAA